MIRYYAEYDAENDRRYVKEYDDKHGVRDISSWGYPDSVAIYHNSLIVNALYYTIEDAVRSWGAWSEKIVILPDGREVTPAEFLHPGYKVSVLIAWNPTIKELWPGEEGY